MSRCDGLGTALCYQCTKLNAQVNEFAYRGANLVLTTFIGMQLESPTSHLLQSSGGLDFPQPSAGTYPS